MKQGRKPTVAQRRWMESMGLDANVWRVCKWTPAEATLVHKLNGEVKVISLLD